jgi:hypothetical protein
MRGDRIVSNVMAGLDPAFQAADRSLALLLWMAASRAAMTLGWMAGSDLSLTRNDPCP